MGGHALGALGPAHQARECRQYSRPTHGLYRDPRGPGGRPGFQGPARGPGWLARGSGAGQGDRGPARGSGASMVLGREIIEMKIYCLGIFARAPPRLGISVVCFDNFGRLFT